MKQVQQKKMSRKRWLKDVRKVLQKKREVLK